MQGPHATYLVYSLILATFLGTMGLPHVVVRFYTNRDGHAARRTTVTVLGLLSAFYLLPTMYGVLGRIYASDLIASGRTDSVVLELPRRILGGPGGDLLTALLGAGAFAAFLSTSSGLVVSVGGVLGQDLLGRWFGGVPAFRIAGVLAVAATLVLTLLSQGLRGRARGRAGLRRRGLDVLPAAAAGHLVARADRPGRRRRALGRRPPLRVGGAHGDARRRARPGGSGRWSHSRPWSPCPLAFATMIGVSLLTRAHLPPHVAPHHGAAAHARGPRPRPGQLPPGERPDAGSPFVAPIAPLVAV